jgi:regulator of protease activity HflC (stomatin/prohibitin superfamily)
MGFEKLFDKFFEFIGLFQFWYKVMPQERAVHYRGGRVLGERAPGFHWKLPFRVDHVNKISVVVDTFNTMAHLALTKEGTPIVISATIVWRVSDVTKFDLEVEDGDNAIVDLAFPAIQEVVKEMTWVELVENPAQAISDRFLTAIRRRKPGRWGIEVLSASLSEIGKARGYRVWQS